MTLAALGEGTFDILDERAGYSNHTIGTTAIAKGAVVDLDGDGVDEILVPDAAQTRLVRLSAREGTLAEQGDVELPAAADTDLVALAPGWFLLGLEDGTLVTLY